MRSLPYVIVVAIVLVVSMLPFTNAFLPNNNIQPNARGSGVVSDIITITTQQDFQNGTMDHLDYSSSPGDIFLDKYSRTYTVGVLDSADPDWRWTAGYTDIFADSRFILPVGGTITQITINVGSYNGAFRVKVLRSTGSNTFYAVATSQDIQPPANQQSSYSVNLPCRAGDYLGIYVIGDLSALSWNGNNGNWYYNGEITNTPVTCTWSTDTVIATMQATLLNYSYYSQGNWTSPIYQLKSTPLSGSVSWSADIPSGTSLTVYVRTSNDGTTWSSWQQVSNGGGISNIQRYVQLWVNFKGTSTKSPILHDISIHYTYKAELTINEISSYGTGNNEWVEIVNTGSDSIKVAGLSISDQDGNVYVVPDAIGTMPPNAYLIVSFGSGTNDYNFDDGVAHLYANFGHDVFNDDGDDVLIYIGNTNIDYVAFGNGGPNSDIDSPPSGLTFTLNGYGYNGYAPCPSAGETISLIPNAVDSDEAKDWFVTSGTSQTPGGKNVNALLVTGQDTSPQQMMQSDEKEILKLNLQSVGTSGDFVATSEIRLSLYTTATDSDIDKVSLYYDSNNNGYWDNVDVLVEEKTFSGNSAIFTSAITINCGNSKVYFVVIKVSLTADINHWIKISLDDVSLAGNDVSFIPNTIQTKSIDIVPLDTTPPEVKEVKFNPQPPVGPGTLTINIEFNENMNTSSPLQVTYGPNGNEYDFTGNWKDNRNWSGTTQITQDMPSGTMTLVITGGKDVVGNTMNEYTTQFAVDTTKPTVVSVEFSKTPPLRKGVYTLKITFSESMNESIPLKVVYGVSRIKDVSGGWVSSTVWEGNLTIDETSENGNNTLAISDGKDLAGNYMESYVTYFVVDTINPTVVYFSIQPSPLEYEGTKIYGGYTPINITVRFSEYVENVSIEFNNVSYKMFRFSSTEFYIQVNTANLKEGMYVLKIIGATDKAGNVMDTYIADSFVIDKTPPDLQIHYSNRTVEGNQIIIKIDVNDDYGIGGVEVVYNSGGIRQKILPHKVGDYYVVTIPGNNVIPDKIIVKITAYDTAGNTKMREITISVESWWHALWWLWLLLILIIILLIFLLLYMRRKRKESEIPMKESVIDKIRNKFKKEGSEYEEFYET